MALKAELTNMDLFYTLIKKLRSQRLNILLDLLLFSQDLEESLGLEKSYFGYSYPFSQLVCLCIKECLKSFADYKIWLLK